MIPTASTLGSALAAVVARLDNPTAFANDLIEALRQPTDRQQCELLGQALAAIAPRLGDPIIFANCLIKALRQTTDPDQLAAIERALGATAPRFDDPTTVVNDLIETLCQTRDDRQWATLGQALAAISRRLVYPCTPPPLWFAELFGTLRYPWFAGTKLEGAVKAALGLSKGATLGDTIAPFRETYPESDLSKPWPEPLC
jgi:hypothetical protein